MIVKLPRPELMKLDKILFKVLRFAVTFDNTQISTVKLGWYFSEDEKFWKDVRSGIWTHAHIRGPECSIIRRQEILESGALDHSAILTVR